MPDSVFVWTISDVVSLVILGLLGLIIGSLYLYAWITDWFRGWRNRR